MTIYAGYIRLGVPPNDIDTMTLEDLFTLNPLVFGTAEQAVDDSGFY